MIILSCGCEVSEDYNFITQVAKKVFRCSKHEEQFCESMAALKEARDSWKILAEGSAQYFPVLAKTLAKKMDDDFLSLLKQGVDNG